MVHGLTSINKKEVIYSILGGIVGLGLIVGYDVLFGVDGTINVAPGILGVCAAGFLAEKNSVRASRAGSGAALILGIPNVILSIRFVRDVTNCHWVKVSPGLLFSSFLITILLLFIYAVVGDLFGKIGGWVEAKTHDTRWFPSAP